MGVASDASTIRLTMEHYLNELKDKRKGSAFLKLLRELDYVRLVGSFGEAGQARLAREFMGSLQDIKAHRSGKLKLNSAKQALDPL